MKQEYQKTQRGQLHVFMGYTSLGCTGLKSGTPYGDSDTFVVAPNRGVYFKDAVQFRTVILAVEIDEPPTKKIRECGAKETQLSLILVIVTSCLIFFQ